MPARKKSRGGSSGSPRRRPTRSPKSAVAPRKRPGSARPGAASRGKGAGGARKSTAKPRKSTEMPGSHQETTTPPHYSTGHGYIHFTNKNKTNTEVAAAALKVWGSSNLPPLGARFFSVSAMDDPFTTSGPGQSRPKGDLVIALVMTSDPPHSTEAHVQIGNIANLAATALSQYFKQNAQEPKHWCCWSDH